MSKPAKTKRQRYATGSAASGAGMISGGLWGQVQYGGPSLAFLSWMLVGSFSAVAGLALLWVWRADGSGANTVSPTSPR